MIIALNNDKHTTINLPDDCEIFYPPNFVTFMKAGSEDITETENVYMSIPARSILYIRNEANTKGYQPAADISSK